MQPQPQQKDMFTKRWRKARKPLPSELQIQISLVAQLQLICRRDVVFYHVPNGELRDKRAAAKLKAMGVLPGVADLVFVWREGDEVKNLYLELKARKRTASPEQLAFAERIIATGGYYHCIDNIDDALHLLREYRIIR